MNLYELTGQYKILETALQLNPDEEEIEMELAKINDKLENKADSYAKIIRNIEGDVLAIDAELKRLQNIKASKVNAVNRLKSNLMESMKQTGKTKFKTSLFSFGVQKNGGLEPLVVDVTVDEIPDEFIKVTKDVDKDALRKYIKETGDFSYGHFGDRGIRLSIR